MRSSGGNDHGGGYLVVFVEVEEFDAHGGPAGGADLFGVDVDDFTPKWLITSPFGGAVDEGDSGDLTLLPGAFCWGRLCRRRTGGGGGGGAVPASLGVGARRLGWRRR